MRKTVLVITSILPVDIITEKKNENDILLVTEEEIKERFSDITFEYIFIIPFVPFFLKFFSKKWNEYYNFRKNSYYNIRGRNVLVVPCLILPKKTAVRELLVRMSLFISKNRINKFVSKIKPTIIHAHNIDNNATIARLISQRFNIAYIITIREKEFIDSIVIKNFASSRKIIGVTLHDIEYVKNIVKIDLNSIVIPHGITIREMNNDKKRCTQDSDTFKIITVSRLLDWKNIDLIITALSKVSFNFEYNIYGVGPEFDKLESLINSYNLSNKVFLHGQISYNEVLVNISRSDVFVLLSYPETFGRVFIESLSVGTPFLANKGIAIKSHFKKDEGGIFIEASEVIETLEFLNNNRNVLENLRLKGLEKVRLFGWDEISSMFYKLY